MDKILDQELLGNIRVCLESMGVTNLDDFLDIDKESMSDFIQIGANVNGDIVTLKLTPLDIKKVLRVQAWFVHHDDPTDDTWATLTEDGYKAWKTSSQAADIRASLVPDTTNIVTTLQPRAFYHRLIRARRYSHKIKQIHLLILPVHRILVQVTISNEELKLIFPTIPS